MVSESFYTGSETVRGFGHGYGYACVCVCVWQTPCPYIRFAKGRAE
jgi:hypothetical protein